MPDILDVTNAQASVLRAIAYYETESGTKGATQYICSEKVPNKLHVSGSTFNDNIQNLEKKLMVLHLKGRTKRNRKTKPYTITAIGQIAWLRYFSLSEKSEVIQKVFPNIQLSVIDEIINQIDHPVIKDIKDNYSKGVLEIALNNFHIETSDFLTEDYVKIGINETIELYGHYDLLKTSFTRNYNIIHPTLFKKVNLKLKESLVFGTNFDELEISIKERMTFLFYYNLIQSVTESASMKIITQIIRTTKKKSIIEMIKKNERGLDTVRELVELSFLITKKKKEIMKIINANKEVSKIMQENLKNLNEYKDQDFQDITNMFIKN